LQWLISLGGSLKIDLLGIHCSDNKLIGNGTSVSFPFPSYFCGCGCRLWQFVVCLSKAEIQQQTCGATLFYFVIFSLWLRVFWFSKVKVTHNGCPYISTFFLCVNVIRLHKNNIFNYPKTKQILLFWKTLLFREWFAWFQSILSSYFFVCVAWITTSTWHLPPAFISLFAPLSTTPFLCLPTNENKVVSPNKIKKTGRLRLTSGLSQTAI